MKYPAETVWVVNCFYAERGFWHYSAASMRVFKNESDAREFYRGVMESADAGETYEISEQVVF